MLKETHSLKPFQFVVFLGDLNSDGKFDVKDIPTAASAFGSFPNHPRWNPTANTNKDGKVGMKDLTLIAKTLGKTYP